MVADAARWHRQDEPPKQQRCVNSREETAVTSAEVIRRSTGLVQI